jgi:hypothetical protein
MAAFHLERYSLAAELAREALNMAGAFERTWNFGNAIHLGHTVQGLLALREGDVDHAVIELEKSGEIRGSPQLNSFGPTMQLAKELLKAGRRDAVLRYLQQCREFWKMGGTWLDVWEQKIQAGGIPNFFMNCYR